jgi:hypothetical protein
MIALKKAQMRERYFPTGGCFFHWTHSLHIFTPIRMLKKRNHVLAGEYIWGGSSTSTPYMPCSFMGKYVFNMLAIVVANSIRQKSGCKVDI